MQQDSRIARNPTDTPDIVDHVDPWPIRSDMNDKRPVLRQPHRCLPFSTICKIVDDKVAMRGLIQSSRQEKRIQVIIGDGSCARSKANELKVAQ